MEIKVKEAVKLFKALGYKSANKWDVERLQKKMNKLSELVEEDTSTGDVDLDNLLATILKADKIKIIKEENEADSGEEETEETAEVEETEETEEAPEVDKDIKEPKKPKQKREKSVKTDKFNCRIGTVNAKINEFLSKKPISAKDIAEKLSLSTPRVKAQLAALVRKNLIVKEEKGYVSKIG